MADGRFSAWQLDQWMTGLFSATHYIALFSSSPFIANPLTVELVGGSYARQLAAFTRTNTYAMTLAADVFHRSLAPGVNIVAIGAFGSAINGNMLWGQLLDVPKAFPTGGTYQIEAGQLVLGVQVPAG